MVTVKATSWEGGPRVTNSILLLLYNLFLTGIYAIAAACAYYFYTQKRDSLFLASGILFCAYLFDNTIVCCTELIPEFASLYDKLFLLTPSVKTIYFVTLIGSMLYIFQKALDILSLKTSVILIGLYAAALISAPMIPENNWKVFIYYLPTQLMMAGLALWGLHRLKKHPDDYQAPYHVLTRKLLILLLLFTACILVEDSIVIFFFDVFAAVGLKINNRNVSENIMFLCFSFCLIRETYKHLSVFSKNLSGTLQISLYPERSPVKLFCMTYGLTDREVEIFERLLDGKSQQEISDELIIALGTVKTHIHNVYQKTGAANRSQLIDQFQSFTEHTVSGPPSPDNFSS